LTRWSGEAAPGHPYWWQNAKPATDLADAPPRIVDILIIGAGYTGLAAAIAAHDAGAEVAVVDAGLPGQGASTRNGGMFGAHPRLGWPALAKSVGPTTADALFAEAKPALESVKHLIKKEKIECDLQNTGRIQLAYTGAHFDAQKQIAEQMRGKSDVNVCIVERGEIGHEINTEIYCGGIVFPEHCAIHPRKFHAGLLNAVLRRRVSVAGNTVVTGWRRTVGGFQVATSKGPVSAGNIILATNGYTPADFRWHQRRVFPLPSYIISTEPLPTDLIAHVAPGRRMMVETRARHSYFRISPDGTRILFGGRASMREIGPEPAARRLRATMLEIWPELGDARIAHSWSGNTGFTFSGMPNIGESDGLFHAMGYSGSGTVMAPYLGTKVGLRAAGAQGGDTAYGDTGLRASWLHPFPKPHFLKAADLWYRLWVDRQESRQARKT
jgi:glycine/D-amino acid oxidase-like deaminating enzyme